MKINLEKQNEIKIGDVIHVKENDKEVNYLICADDERCFLIDLANFYILGVYSESSVEEFLENNEMELIEIIPSSQIELRRIN